MSHVRQQIREAVVSALKGITAFGDRVYGYQGKTQRAVPYVVVRTANESVKPEETTFGSAGKPTLMRSLQLDIEVRAKAAVDPDDIMDGYAVSIEEKMAGTALDDLAVSVWPNETRIETAETNENLEKDAALMTLTYLVEYRTAEGSPETAVL
jgi:hypothetical protein